MPMMHKVRTGRRCFTNLSNKLATVLVRRLRLPERSKPVITFVTRIVNAINVGQCLDAVERSGMPPELLDGPLQVRYRGDEEPGCCDIARVLGCVLKEHVDYVQHSSGKKASEDVSQELDLRVSAPGIRGAGFVEAARHCRSAVVAFQLPSHKRRQRQPCIS